MKPVRDAMVATGGLCAPVAPLPAVTAKKAADAMLKLVLAAQPDVTQLAMVAVYPESGEAASVAAYGDTDPDKLHVTMVFLGDVTKIDMKAAARAVGSASGSTKPMSGKVGGVGLFGASEEGVYPQIAIPNVQGLAALRVLLVEKLAEEGIVSPSEHDWVPHMTLAYIDEPALPDVDVIGSTLTFNQLSLVVEDVRKDFPLDPQGSADDVHRPDPGEKAAARTRFTRAGLRRREMLLTQAKELT